MILKLEEAQSVALALAEAFKPLLLLSTSGHDKFIDIMEKAFSYKKDNE